MLNQGWKNTQYLVFCSVLFSQNRTEHDCSEHECSVFFHPWAQDPFKTNISDLCPNNYNNHRQGCMNGHCTSLMLTGSSHLHKLFKTIYFIFELLGTWHLKHLKSKSLICHHRIKNWLWRQYWSFIWIQSRFSTEVWFASNSFRIVNYIF